MAASPPLSATCRGPALSPAIADSTALAEPPIMEFCSCCAGDTVFNPRDGSVNTATPDAVKPTFDLLFAMFNSTGRSRQELRASLFLVLELGLGPVAPSS